MKPGITLSILLLAVAFFSTVADADDCSFSDIQESFSPSEAKAHAQSAFHDGDPKFYGVADGVGPSRPGFQDIGLTRCLMLDAKWEMLWVGADSTACEDGAALRRKAIEYAELFNMEMLNLLSKDASFICASDLEAAE